LAEVGPLGAAVAFAERVGGVDLAEVVRQPEDEGIAIEAPQVVFRGEAVEGAIEVGPDVLPVSEGDGSCNVDGA